MQARIEHRPAAIIPRWPFFQPSARIVRPENKPLHYCRSNEVAETRSITDAIEAADALGYDGISVDGIPLSDGVTPPSLQITGEEERWRVMVDDYELLAVCDNPDDLAKKVDHMEYIHGPGTVHCLVERGGLTAAEIAGRIGDRIRPQDGYHVNFDEREATCHIAGMDRAVTVRFDTDGELTADLLTNEGPGATNAVRKQIGSAIEEMGFRHTFTTTGQQPLDHDAPAWDGPAFGVGPVAAASSEPPVPGRPRTEEADTEPAELETAGPAPR